MEEQQVSYVALTVFTIYINIIMLNRQKNAFMNCKSPEEEVR